MPAALRSSSVSCSFRSDMPSCRPRTFTSAQHRNAEYQASHAGRAASLADRNVQRAAVVAHLVPASPQAFPIPEATCEPTYGSEIAIDRGALEPKSCRRSAPCPRTGHDLRPLGLVVRLIRVRRRRYRPRDSRSHEGAWHDHYNARIQPSPVDRLSRLEVKRSV